MLKTLQTHKNVQTCQKKFSNKKMYYNPVHKIWLKQFFSSTTFNLCQHFCSYICICKKNAHFHHFTFFAWQYSFSITFPRTHGRLEVPVAAKMQQSSTLDKDSLNTPFIYIRAGIEDKPLCTFRTRRRGEKLKFSELNSVFFFIY